MASFLPLLGNVESGPIPSSLLHRFPRFQFAILCLLRTLDPMNFTQIFPYVNDFVLDLHLTSDPAQIGYYCGLLESSFALLQLLAIYPWGLVSDRVGRRPVVLVGIAGVASATISFGLSRSFTMALLSRALAGLFSGNVTVIPSMVCEITSEKTQAFAYSFFGLWWPLGAIIGPLIGGLFSNPATKYPRYFDTELMRSYPYFLPCLLVSSCTSLGLLLSLCFLEETLQPRETKQLMAPRAYGSTRSETHSTASRRHISFRKLFNIPIIQALCYSGCALSFMSTAFEVIFVQFCFSPVSAGGLGFPAAKIGFALSIAGVIAALLQGLFMPTILRRVDHASMYHFCMKLWPIAILLMPLLNVIARRGEEHVGMQNLSFSANLLLWTSIALILGLARIAHLPYTINVLLVKRYVPHRFCLGSTLAMVQFCICFSRAFSPALASLVYTSSIRSNSVLGGNLWVASMVAMGLLSCSLSKMVVKESLKLSGGS
ncbi:MFS general substrate transporter [Agrocybe pediades]|nr:MFS general substrate transporter [Agrocybe pediades]